MHVLIPGPSTHFPGVASLPEPLFPFRDVAVSNVRRLRWAALVGHRVGPILIETDLAVARAGGHGDVGPAAQSPCEDPSWLVLRRVATPHRFKPHFAKVSRR